MKDEKPAIQIIKLGGSSITDKSKFETLNETNIQWVSNTLSSAINQNTKIILIHGAGSFGHFHAKECGLRGVKEEDYLPTKDCNVSASNDKRILEGLSKTRISVQKLNLSILSSLTKGDIPVIGLSPFSISPTLHNIPCKLGANLQEIIDNDIIPVLHGDCILLPSSNKVGILGGDKLVTHAASHFIQMPNAHTMAVVPAWQAQCIKRTKESKQAGHTNCYVLVMHAS